MAHFIGSVTGNRGPAHRLGSQDSGISTKIQGWGSGVSVFGFVDDETGRDAFRIIATGGSRGYGSKQVGYVTTNKKGNLVFKKKLG